MRIAYLSKFWMVSLYSDLKLNKFFVPCQSKILHSSRLAASTKILHKLYYCYLSFQQMLIRINRQAKVNENHIALIIQISESMFEFIPFNPFSNSNLNNEEPGNQESSHKQPPESTLNSSGSFDFPQDQHQIKHQKYSKQKRQSSHNHNMVKQLIITIKQMMRSSVKNVGAGKVKKVVEEIWEIFMTDIHPNKELLKALFDSDRDEKLLQKYKLSQVIASHGIDDYKQAIQELKKGILFKMKSEHVKSHLLDRRVQHKERLAAVILYFLHQEMKVGKIAYRQSEKATQKIENILLQSKKEQNFMDSFFQSQEVIERFASINNETS